MYKYETREKTNLGHAIDWTHDVIFPLSDPDVALISDILIRPMRFSSIYDSFLNKNLYKYIY